MSGPNHINRQFLRSSNEGFTVSVRVRDHRATKQIACVLGFRAKFVILLLLILATAWQPAGAQLSDTIPAANPSPLTVKQVVRNLARLNLHRVEAFHDVCAEQMYRRKAHENTQVLPHG